MSGRRPATTAGSWTEDPYTRAISLGRGPLRLRAAGGWSLPLDVERWCAGADAADLTVLDRCRGAVLDIGCGPGRLVAALRDEGHPSLGIDVNPAAVARTVRRGGRAVRRSVFDPLPAPGSWDTALLMDGNIGIGGDPELLLRRVAQLVRPGGLLLAEVAREDVDERLRVWLESAQGGTGTPFPWARLGASALDRLAGPAGWTAQDAWSKDSREFLALRRVCHGRGHRATGSAAYRPRRVRPGRGGGTGPCHDPGGAGPVDHGGPRPRPYREQPGGKDRAVKGKWPGGTMRAARITGLGRTDLATVPVPGPEPGSVLVRTRKVGICGTDLEILHGTSAFLQDGRITFPHVFGHEWYGEVVAYAEEPPADAPGVGTLVVGRTMVPCGRCADCHAGRTQSCAALREVGLYGLQGGAADYVRVPAHALTPLPASLPEPAGALVEPAVSVVEAFERARLRFDDRVAVVGTGTMGLLAVQFARHHAAAVDAVGIDGAGLDLALRCGADAAHHADDVPEHAYSLVVEASGAASAFTGALRMARRGGRVALVGVAREPVSFVPGELSLQGVDVLGIQHGVFHYDRTVALFERGVLDAAPLVAEVFPAASASAAFALLERGRSGPPKILLDFGG
ncbi:alcohol dehydrogenase catalytic domain-containing protein [Streptomyces albus subsp. chlorinus]|uniref:alcohol dehydrogenase catalytic domain-containing protein n=1 Tax=Streptomyces albus TaxID=1888 RepID=UPI003D12F7E8